MINCYSYGNIFSNISRIKYINLYYFKNDKIISSIFNNINSTIFVCQKNKIINNIKAYNCCDSNLESYDCISSNNENNIPSNTDNSKNENSTQSNNDESNNKNTKNDNSTQSNNEKNTSENNTQSNNDESNNDEPNNENTKNEKTDNSETVSRYQSDSDDSNTNNANSSNINIINHKTKSSSSISVGAIIGIIAGGLVVVFVIIFFCKKCVCQPEVKFKPPSESQYKSQTEIPIDYKDKSFKFQPTHGINNIAIINDPTFNYGFFSNIYKLVLLELLI